MNLLKGNRILGYCGRYRREAGWHHPAVEKPGHLLLHVEEGEMTVTVGESRTRLLPHSLYLIPRGTPYAVETAVGFLHTAFCFSLGKEETELLSLPSHCESDGEIRRCLDSALAEGVTSLRAEIALLSALARIAENATREQDGPLVAECKRYLEEHLAKDVSLTALATHIGYTPPYVVKLFRRQCGITPMAYLAELRLAQSAAALADLTRSIREIALASGFPDANYFSRAFRRHYGVSPSEYRRRLDV